MRRYKRSSCYYFKFATLSKIAQARGKLTIPEESCGKGQPLSICRMWEQAKVVSKWINGRSVGGQRLSPKPGIASGNFEIQTAGNSCGRTAYCCLALQKTYKPPAALSSQLSWFILMLLKQTFQRTISFRLWYTLRFFFFKPVEKSCCSETGIESFITRYHSFTFFQVVNLWVWCVLSGGVGLFVCF